MNEQIKLTLDTRAWREALSTTKEEIKRITRELGLPETPTDLGRLYDGLKHLSLSEEESRRLYEWYKLSPVPRPILRTASAGDWEYRPSTYTLDDVSSKIYDESNGDVPLVGPDNLGDSFLLVTLSEVAFFSSHAEGMVRVEETEWRYYLTRNSFDVWFCDILGGYLARLSDGSLVIVCQIED